jgi:hypothetical protein
MTRRAAVVVQRNRRDMRVRHMELEQYLYLRDVEFGGLASDGALERGSGIGGRIATARRASLRR